MIPTMGGFHNIGYLATQASNDVSHREPLYMTIDIGNACTDAILVPKEIHIKDMTSKLDYKIPEF